MKSIVLRNVLVSCVLIVVAFCTFGCDEITNATAIDVPITTTVTLVSNNPTLPTTSEDCVDLSANKDFNDNKDKIKGGTISKIGFQITDLQTPSFDVATAVISNVKLQMVFAPEYGDNTVYEMGEFSNVKISDVITYNYNVNVNSAINTVIGLIPSRPKFCFRAVYGSIVGASTAQTASRIEGKLAVTFKFEVPTI